MSQKRSTQGTSNHGAILRQPCRYHLKSTCTRWPCEYWHPPSVNSYRTETGCKAGDKCLIPHHKVDEQPNKKPKKGYYSHKRRDNDDKNAVAVVKIVPQLGCLSQDPDPLVSQRETVRGKPGAKSWDQFEEYDSRSLRHVKQVSEKSLRYGKQVSEKRRTIAWKNTSQTSSSAKHVQALHSALPRKNG